MGELHDWLSQQHHGLKTYKAFRQTLIDRVSSDAQHRALYRLLAGLTEEYIARYDAEAVPVEVADQTYRHMLEIVATAEKALTASAQQQIQILNELAAAKLV
ncbi:hypothetical protein [Bradyrhizobium erythrophlei]|jgi:hypothetical protein|uniref:Uncharacterized protein n=1 Tax=Bradyrhizobium erythrophlei TaxID=1437360 RepID=A0A1M7T9C7_9BRAD|nr:hypothetical protein [Bradyrhizobium erythrophlei]SHN67287.1 hypothetical protein SAMN05444170_1155 [Bradyrhizobium erythrophlei]